VAFEIDGSSILDRRAAVNKLAAGADSVVATAGVLT
jgi:hypothetical protein